MSVNIVIPTDQGEDAQNTKSGCREAKDAKNPRVGKWKSERGQENPAKSRSSCFLFGYSSMSLWRFCFYCLMAYNWFISYHGPFERLSEFTTYDHTEWIYDFAPRTSQDAEKIRYFGTLVAVISTFNNSATVIFAFMTGQSIFTNIVLFINHNYLFFLLSTLMAFYCNCRKDDNHGKACWIHAIRGQIVVVYAFASLWKFDSDWLSGQIVKGIFISFEEQGDHRGVPWSALNKTFPWLFRLIGLSGLCLDFMLFFVLMFLPPGHKLQQVGFLFHGFTGYTMAQRIGYSFPIGMIFAGLLFQRSDVIEKAQESLGGDTLSHAKWLAMQFRMRPDDPDAGRIQHGVKKKNLLPIVFLVVQWLIPLRMPIVSRGEFRHTFEGYRWSWTMMLHSKSTFHSPGLSYMTLRAKCGNLYFPNQAAAQSPVIDIQSLPYEMLLQNNLRTLSVLQMFPRQMPKVAGTVAELSSLDGACNAIKGLQMTTSYFASTNEGPYHRLIDPTSNLLEVHRTHMNLPWLSKLWYAIIDKAPRGQEFILRGAGSIDIPSKKKMTSDEVTFVDRSPCLQVDPIRIQINNFDIEFDSTSGVDRLVLMGCNDVALKECKELIIHKGEKMSIPAIRSVTIGIHRYENLGISCSETTKEDLVIKLTNLSLPK
mmetsp:Transcript_21123/g.58757  ORF Transcript_21123/g.58757 Transcript_21123/m.58757 type:complete len:650 (+) Transcript_21123:83-2032(+)